MNTLYLTAAEKEAYDMLPEDIREGWEVVDETLDAYETDRQLMMRAHMSTMHKYKAMQEIAEKLKNGTPAEEIDLGGIPDEMLPDFYFTIGARGLRQMIAYSFQLCKDDEDIKGVASLTWIRHQLLESNASVPSR